MNRKSEHRILVVDDNEAIHDDFRKILEIDADQRNFDSADEEMFGSSVSRQMRLGFDLEFATQGKQALEIVRKACEIGRRFSLVFMDVRMPPGWDGFETSMKLWDLDPDLLVVICTAYSDKSWEQMMELVSNPERVLILKKPFDAIEVLQLAHALTEKWSLLQASRRNLLELERTVDSRTSELVAANRLLKSEMARHKTAADRIREQAMLLEKARDAIMVWDLDHTVRFWNHGAECLYGWTAAEALGRSIFELLDCDCADEVLQTASNRILNKEVWSGELSRRNHDAGLVTAECRWTLVRDDHGQPKSILGIHTDITGKKQSEANYLRAQRLESIGTLAGGIAHDLNNILQPITLAMDLLRAGAPDPASRRMLDLVTENSQRATSLVKQLLSFARGAEGERISIRPTDLTRETARMIRETFPKNIELRMVSPDDPTMMWGDGTQLHQVLLNLSVNARDAMPDGGVLTLGVDSVEIEADQAATQPDAVVGSYVVLTVGDTGSGIPPALRERIFDPFFTTKAPGSGTGLGLATTLSIVRGHGGFITMESHEGVGTTFRVFIPAGPDEPSAPAESSAEPVIPHGDGELILLVDDEEPILNLMRQTLGAFGYRVLTCSNGAEAEQVFLRHADEISAVITDMVMPVMDGPHLIAGMKKLRPAIKVIAISGMTTDASIDIIARHGVQGVISKPFTVATILQTLRQVLAESAAPATTQST